MEQARFSALTRSLRSRRSALAGLAILAAAGAGAAEEARSKKKQKKKKVCFRRYTRCGGQCIDTLNDPEHCGTCQTRCDAGVDCVMGVCGSTA